MPNCCRRNTNARSQSLHLIFDVEHFLGTNPSPRSTTIPTNLLDLRTKRLSHPLFIHSAGFRLRTNPHRGCIPLRSTGEEGRRICTSNDGRGNSPSFCGNYTAINFSAITGTAYSETPDLDPVKISYGSGLQHNCVITCLMTRN